MPGSATVSFGDALRVWAKIGLLSFGGPAGQIALMHRVLVDEKKWIDEARFLHALNYCMLLPGPEAQQLATYVGWLLHRTKGGLAAGLLFILPGVIALMGLSAVYALYGAVDAVAAVFFGLKAAVLAIVLQALLRVGAKALRGPAMVGVAGAAFVALFVFQTPFPLVVLAAGALGYCGGRLGWRSFGPAQGAPPIDRSATHGSTAPTLRAAARTLSLWGGLWLVPVLALWLWLGRGDVFVEIALFFSKMAVVTFGGAYAVLAYVAQEAVAHQGWLAQGEMLDGLGLAETTPGPLILVLQFVGFLAAFRDPGALSPLVAGLLGGLLTVWVTFVPCFLWIFLGAPSVERLRGHRPLSAALSTITAAVVGVILNLALWFGLHVLFAQTSRVTGLGGWIALDLPVIASVDGASLILTVGAALALVRFKAPVTLVLAGCAVAGWALRLAA